MDSAAYRCPVCRGYIGPDDRVVRSVEIRRLSTGQTQRLVGEWFHERCWGEGVTPFEEIDRGRLRDVLERS